MFAAAAAVLLLLCGGLAGYFIANTPDIFEEADAFEDQWIDAVAGQLSLYNADSLSAIQVNDAEQKSQLSKLATVLDVDLSESRVALDGLTLKRADLLHFQGRKIAELLYASEHGPVAFCIAAAPGPSF